MNFTFARLLFDRKSTSDRALFQFPLSYIYTCIVPQGKCFTHQIISNDIQNRQKLYERDRTTLRAAFARCVARARVPFSVCRRLFESALYGPGFFDAKLVKARCVRCAYHMLVYEKTFFSFPLLQRDFNKVASIFDANLYKAR